MSQINTVNSTSTANPNVVSAAGAANAASAANAEKASQPAAPARSGATLTPAVDVIEDSAGITLYADLPGVPRDKLNLEINADTLTIDAEVGLPVPEAMKSSHAEVHLNRYRRVFTLSKELDTEKVTADLSQGVLTVRIPKAAHAQPRRIEIQSA